ncbi:MAG TPA: kelch repeat-containing protein, partial [Oculatellaceae cyanobacterium]
MCLQVIAGSLTKTPASQIAKLPLECMKLLVQADETSADEISIFQACVSWSQSHGHEDGRCLLPLIRFQNMTPARFAQHVVPSGLLTPEQMLPLMTAGVCGELTARPRHQPDSIFVMGGYNGHRYLESAFELDASADAWKPLPDMLDKRAGLGACVCHGILYSVGGGCLSGTLASTETLDLTVRDKWVMAPPMLQERCSHAVCSAQGKVYAIGGRDDRYEELASAESFDPDKGVWTAISPMSTARANFSAAELDGKIFVTGGWDINGVLSS